MPEDRSGRNSINNRIWFPIDFTAGKGLMNIRQRSWIRTAMAGLVAFATWTGSPLHAKPPTVEDALQKISPVQAEISYDRPDADAVSKCKLESINQEIGRAHV